MTRDVFETIHNYMPRMADPSAHDALHIYRVPYQALKNAAGHQIHRVVLIAACLLHDIGRKARFADSRVCHAQEGGKRKALLEACCAELLKEIDISDPAHIVGVQE